MAIGRELFELRSGRIIMDEDLSEKMYVIKSYHPERAGENSSGFEWSEMGMANLFGLLCNKEARYCREYKSWYTYFEGAWRRGEGAYVLSARKFNAEMERHPEWFDRKSTSNGFVIYWGLKLKEVI